MNGFGDFILFNSWLYLVQVCLEGVRVNRVRIAVLAVEFECSVSLRTALAAVCMELRVCIEDPVCLHCSVFYAGSHRLSAVC